MVQIQVDFESLLDVVDQLSEEQKRILRQRLDKEWSTRFGTALKAIHDDMPTDISSDEIEADIEVAIDEVRH